MEKVIYFERIRPTDYSKEDSAPAVYVTEESNGWAIWYVTYETDSEEVTLKHYEQRSRELALRHGVYLVDTLRKKL